MLAGEFEIAGTAADGREALNEARRLAPDVIVLDIAMPGLNGFQTARALAEDGSHVPIVFLSTHDANDCVEEAFAAGGRGFVAKTRLQPDLASALNHVLSGRMFMPSLAPMLPLVEDGSGHAMHLYSDERILVCELADLFDHALQRGDATCLIAEEPLREGLERGLQARGWAVDDASGRNRFRTVDAEEAVFSFVRHGLPDVARVADIANELDLYRLTSAEGPLKRLTIFGNMASHLSRRGNAPAAMALERTWAALTNTLPFFTVCGYSMESVHSTPHPEFFSSVCDAHWAIAHAHAL
jgi:CheY-like chemotaxis protein